MIHVKIMDRNDHPPSFGQRLYEVDVDEIAPVHTPLIILNATDTDAGKNAGEPRSETKNTTTTTTLQQQ